MQGGRRQRVLPAAEKERRAGDGGKPGAAVGARADSTLLALEGLAPYPLGHGAENGREPAVGEPLGVHQQSGEQAHLAEGGRSALTSGRFGSRRFLRGSLALLLGPRRGVEQGEPGHPLRRPAHDLQGDIAPQRNTGESEVLRLARQHPGRHGTHGVVPGQIPYPDIGDVGQPGDLVAPESSVAERAGEQNQGLPAPAQRDAHRGNGPRRGAGKRKKWRQWLVFIRKFPT